MSVSGDFVAYSFEQFASFLDGIVFSRELAKAILSDKLVMIPLLLFIWLWGFFWWSRRVKDLKDLAKFFLWLVAVTLLYSYITTTWNVRVAFVPTYTYDATVESEWKPVELRPYTKVVEGAGSVLFFSVPDRIANFFYRFIVETLPMSDKKEVLTVEVGKCINPDAVYTQGLLIGFQKYLKNSYGTYKDVNEFIETVRECVWSLGELDYLDPSGIIYAVSRKVSGVDARCEEFLRTIVNEGMTEVIEACKSVMGEKFDEEAFRKGMKLCVEKKIPACKRTLEKIVEVADRLDKVFWSIPLKGMESYLGNTIQEATADVAQETTKFYLSYKTKWLVTLKVQGLLLGILIGFSPFLFLLSFIPIGNNAINYNLFFITFVSYLLIKLWIPALYLVHYFAYHTIGFGS